MRLILFILMIIAFSSAAVSQPNKGASYQLPVVGLSCGSNILSLGAHEQDCLPAYRTGVSLGLEMPYYGGSVTPHLCLMADATRASCDNVNITKHFWTAALGVEYDYRISSRWFVGADVSLGVTRLYHWTTSNREPTESMLKPVAITVESELDDMKTQRPMYFGIQAIVGFIMTDNIKLRLAIVYDNAKVGDRVWFCQDAVKGSLLGMSVAIQYRFDSTGKLNQN